MLRRFSPSAVALRKLGSAGSGICSVYPALLSFVQCSGQETGLSSFHSLLEHPCLPQCAGTGIIALGNSRIMPWNDAAPPNPCRGAFFPLSRNHLLETLSNPFPASSTEEPNGKHPQGAVLGFVMAKISSGMLGFSLRIPCWV